MIGMRKPLGIQMLDRRDKERIYLLKFLLNSVKFIVRPIFLPDGKR